MVFLRRAREREWESQREGERVGGGCLWGSEGYSGWGRICSRKDVGDTNVKLSIPVTDLLPLHSNYVFLPIFLSGCSQDLYPIFRKIYFFSKFYKSHFQRCDLPLDSVKSWHKTLWQALLVSRIFSMFRGFLGNFKSRTVTMSVN